MRISLDLTIGKNWLGHPVSLNPIVDRLTKIFGATKAEWHGDGHAILVLSNEEERWALEIPNAHNDFLCKARVTEKENKDD